MDTVADIIRTFLAWCTQVLFNIAPVSYTSACTHASNSAVRSSVVPPGITVPTSVEPPPLVHPATPTSLIDAPHVMQMGYHQ